MLPTFPDFVRLDLELKEPYNRAVEHLTPFSDISFTTLQIWWNLSENLLVSVLDDNLIIKYELPSDPKNSGFCIVGRNNIDQSIKKLFAYIHSKKMPVELVHVPEFVVELIEDKRELKIIEEHDYDEYILDSNAFEKLEGSEYQLLRKKIKRFIRSTENKQLTIKSLDLTLGEVQDELFKSIAEWEDKNSPNNDPEHVEHKALKKSMTHSLDLEIKNLALYIDEKLHGFIIYHRPLNKDYYVLSHLKANYENPYISDYLHHQVAKRAVDENVPMLNIEMDLGIENLRKHKMTLRPTAFLHKYRISPVN